MRLTDVPSPPAVTTPPAPLPGPSAPGSYQPPLPGVEAGLVAYVSAPSNYYDQDVNKPVKVAAGAPVAFSGAFQDAVYAANDIVAADFAKAKFGIFHQRNHAVNAMAVLAKGDGFELVRVDKPIDSWHEENPGSMFWPQYTKQEITTKAQRQSDELVALVGAKLVFDLRHDGEQRVQILDR
jgi:hypothetical protein